MKRSRMIEEIKDLLVISFDCSRTYGESVAEDILVALEKAGMKPPVQKRCAVLLRETHTWEPENVPAST